MGRNSDIYIYTHTLLILVIFVTYELKSMLIHDNMDKTANKEKCRTQLSAFGEI